MSPAAILTQLRAAGVTIRADEGRLLASPKEALKGPLLDLVRQNKTRLLAHLEGDYTASDLAEIDRLIHQLAEIEGWSPADLEDALDQRRRMAPVRVLEALRELREAVKRSLDPWPEKPAKRSRIVLCRLASQVVA